MRNATSSRSALAQHLPVHLAGVAVERHVSEVDVCFLTELEEVVTAIVQHRNPVERHLVEDGAAVHVERRSRELVEKGSAFLAVVTAGSEKIIKYGPTVRYRQSPCGVDRTALSPVATIRPLVPWPIS